MRPLIALLASALASALAIAGCGGGNIEDTVRDQYPAYATKHHFDTEAKTVDRVTCNTEATRDYDGWCRIRPKGFTLTYNVPYRDGKPLWGESEVR